jgi:hypothetical protein
VSSFSSKVSTSNAFKMLGRLSEAEEIGSKYNNVSSAQEQAKVHLVNGNIDEAVVMAMTWSKTSSVRNGVLCFAADIYLTAGNARKAAKALAGVSDSWSPKDALVERLPVKLRQVASPVASESKSRPNGGDEFQKAVVGALFSSLRPSPDELVRILRDGTAGLRAVVQQRISQPAPMPSSLDHF